MKKRILILFLCVVFATSALLIPASASDPDYGPFDHLVTSDKPYATVITNSLESLLFISELEWVSTGTSFSLPTCNWVLYEWDGTEWVFDKNGSDAQTCFFTPLSANYNVKDSDGDIVLFFVECDGTSCSASDLNFDDVCDDCGGLLASDLRVTPTVIEIVVKHSDALTLRYVYTETLADTSFDAVYADDAITVSFDNPVNHVQYQSVDGEWVEYASSATVSSSHNISFVDPASIVSSDLSIYDASGNLFFGPPAPILPGSLEGIQMTEVLMEIVKILPIVLVCLVGWIGLRKGLALLVQLLRKA